MSSGIIPVGDWQKQMEGPLNGALQASVEISGRTMAEACKHAIILMAQSARALTPQAKKNRRVLREGAKGRHYLEKYQKGHWMTKWYLPNPKTQPEEYAEMLANFRPIASRGLAKRSWMWGLRGLDSSKAGTRPMAGIANTRTVFGPDMAGYILTNRLSYLLKIMPAGWKQTVATKAGNKIMKQAKMKLERKWQAAMRQKQRARQAGMINIGKYFLKV